ncbi:GIY-YIG nuclease family protein [Novosphingobium sp. ZN18A2]|uniref:GIY-YIG nuclease family protein n=1 Tax=Novosphingobium sp. ZN18A2 TaxID=3079861 RepID=UPI0030CEF82E
MKQEDRKAAVRGYKEREVEAGIYAVRCAPSAQVWVGSAPDLSTIRNRIWFTLRQGRNTHRALQQAWNEHGEGAFAFEILERLGEEDSGLARERVLKSLRLDWTERLGALRL